MIRWSNDHVFFKEKGYINTIKDRLELLDNAATYRAAARALGVVPTVL